MSFSLSLFLSNWKIHALIIGPEGTPYQSQSSIIFFSFSIRMFRWIFLLSSSFSTWLVKNSNDLIVEIPFDRYFSPIRSPRCRLMTTGNGTVRFNPNLYKNGKICLSILGFVSSIQLERRNSSEIDLLYLWFHLSTRTWTGPAWSPAQCLASVLLSIQSLMSECPYHNEPGFEKVFLVFN